jgi:hypothetical protein
MPTTENEPYAKKVEVITLAVAAERERCAKIAEDFPAQVLHIYDRPGSPPGNAMVPSTGKHIADAIRQTS